MNDISEQFVPPSAGQFRPPPPGSTPTDHLTPKASRAAEVVYHVAGALILIPLAVVAMFIAALASATGSCGYAETASEIEQAQHGVLMVGLIFSVLPFLYAGLGKLLKRTWWPWATFGGLVIIVTFVSATSIHHVHPLFCF